MKDQSTASHPQQAALQLNLLYVDDDPINLRVVSDLLGAIGVKVTATDNGAEGLAILLTQPFDLVLLDMHMPKMSGPEVLAELRRLPGPTGKLPVVALTADLSRNEAQYRALGFDGFIAKPVSLRTLLNGVLQAMGERTRREPARRSA